MAGCAARRCGLSENGLEQLKTDSAAVAIASARAAYGAGARDIVVLDLRSVVDFTDFFVVVTGEVSRHLDAIAREVEDGLEQIGEHVRLGGGHEGRGMAGWVLLDFVDVVVHVFSPQLREYYELEELWGDVPQIEWRADPQNQGAQEAAKQSQGDKE